VCRPERLVLRGLLVGQPESREFTLKFGVAGLMGLKRLACPRLTEPGPEYGLLLFLRDDRHLGSGVHRAPVVGYLVGLPIDGSDRRIADRAGHRDERGDHHEREHELWTESEPTQSKCVQHRSFDQFYDRYKNHGSRLLHAII